jgi:hypothetical protein
MSCDPSKLKTRSRGSPEWVKTQSDFVWYTWPTGAGGTNEGMRDRDLNHERSTGQCTKDFRKRQKSGELLPMTYWKQYKVAAKRRGSYYVRYDTDPNSGFTNQIIGDAWQNPTMPNPVLGEEGLLALIDHERVAYEVQRCWANAYNRGWDALTFIGELRETLAMFRGVAGRVIGLANRWKLESIWLEGRYGWRTLLFDIQDIIKAINNVNDGLQRFKETTHSNDEWTEDLTSSYGFWSGEDGIWEQVGSVVTRISYRGTAVVDLDPPNVAFNPLTTAWELTKFSFVVDWLIDVGQYLESLSALAISAGGTSAGGVKIERSLFCQGSWETKGPHSSGDCTSECTSVEDLTLRLPQSPSLRPLIRWRVTGWKIADLLALLTQILRH